MNVCMTHSAFYPTTGGVESHLLDLCQELARQGNPVHALVGTLAGQPEREEIQGVQVTRHPLMNPERIRDRKRERGLTAEQEDSDLRRDVREMYRQFFDAHRIEVVHGHNLHHFVPEHALALTDLWERGMPNLLTVHEIWRERICEDLLQRAHWDTIITFSDHVTQGLLEQAPHLDNVRKVSPGIDVVRFSPENCNPKWAEPLGLEDRPVIIHPTRMLPEKGVLQSVRAMEKVHREYPNAVLMITDTEDGVDRSGELKSYKEEVFHEIRASGLERNVLTQTFPYAELPWIYTYCQVVIYPAIGEEAFGLVPVEAMACGRPAVVSRIGGLAEPVVDGETGFIVEKEDANALAERILMLLRDKALAERLGRAGRERAVRFFSRDRMARETADLYRSAQQRRGSSPALEYALA